MHAFVMCPPRDQASEGDAMSSMSNGTAKRWRMTRYDYRGDGCAALRAKVGTFAEVVAAIQTQTPQMSLPKSR